MFIKNNFYFEATPYFVKKLLYFPYLLKSAKCTASQRDKKNFKTGLHKDTGYPVQTPNLYLILTFLIKKVIIIFFLYSIIKY